LNWQTVTVCQNTLTTTISMLTGRERTRDSPLEGIQGQLVTCWGRQTNGHSLPLITAWQGVQRRTEGVDGGIIIGDALVDYWMDLTSVAKWNGIGLGWYGIPSEAVHTQWSLLRWRFARDIL
jgi:hypothetical protein